MPSVASDLHHALPSRHHQSNARQSGEARDSGSPFAELLDVAGQPAPRSTQTSRPDRSEQSRPANDRKSDAAPAKDRAGDAKNDCGNVDDEVEADSSATEPKTADAKSETPSGEAPEAAADAEQAEAIDQIPTNAEAAAVPPPATPDAKAAPVTTPVVAAVAQAAVESPETGTEPDILAAVAASGQRAAAPKLAEPAKGDVQGAAPLKPMHAEGDEKAAIPPVEAENQTKGDKPAAHLRQDIDPIAKPDSDAQSPRSGDAAAALKAGADAMQPLSALGTGHASAVQHAATVATPAQAHAQAQAAAVPLGAVAVEIASQALAGKNRFEIRLDPPELGRIDVRLEVDRDGNVTSKLVVDRAETLDLLKRDQAQLERTLQQAGLKTSDNALEFSLRQQSHARDDQASNETPSMAASDEDPAPVEPVRQHYGRLLGQGGGLDIRV